MVDVRGTTSPFAKLREATEALYNATRVGGYGGKVGLCGLLYLRSISQSIRLRVTWL
jgi:hypothetical protein